MNLIKTAVIVVVILVAVVAVVSILACCKISGDCSREEENNERK